MKIGMLSTRLAGVDGVSLEAPKLTSVFRAMDHEVLSAAGDLDEANSPGRVIPEMHFEHPAARALHDAAFATSQPSPELFRRLYADADALREQLEAFVDDFGLELLISQNSNAIPMNLALGVAITELVKRRRLKLICHNHDLYWERTRFINNHIQDVLNDAFPPNLSLARHMLISTPMQRRLQAWRGMSSFYLPNVFDFENPPPPPDAYALTFRQQLGLSDDDLIVLQPTRVIRRKVIEKAVEWMRKLDDPRLILLITGYEGDEPGGYGPWLREEADRAGIRYRFIADRIGPERSEHNGKRIYTLWDIYPQAHLITYPSDYEGFGNALIEAVYFRKPLIVHTYPVYVADIKSRGIQAVEYHYDITPEALAAARQLIDHATLRDRMTAHNYQVGLQHFSYAVLRDTLPRVLASFE